MTSADYDVFIVGGGINGCGIARDAAGRGYRVMLAEKADLASGTSSASTKLIHGGLRYLEHYEFRLVREALREREVLWANAPHIAWPLRFILPHHRGLRPAWLLRLGLFLYDHLGGRRLLPVTRTLDLRTDPAGRPLKPVFSKAFEYSDCWVEDTRLVVLNARDAVARGAVVETRQEVVRAERQPPFWRIVLHGGQDGRTRSVTARVLVNAAGPWAEDVLARAVGVNESGRVRLVKGSHLVVRRLFDHDRCYIFQNADRRIIFAIPYEGDFTLIGTTDEDFEGDPADAAISEREIDYLCQAASEYFAQPVTRPDIVWTYAGVRPLYNAGGSKAQEATRDYVIKREPADPPLISLFGGKITTYRKVAESVLDQIGAAMGSRGAPWTHAAPLPGGDFPVTGRATLLARLAGAFPFLGATTLERLVRTYGTLAGEVLGGARTEGDLGRHFGAGLYQREVEYLMRREWARTAEDVVWRRSKLGLRLDAAAIGALAAFMQEAGGHLVAAQ